MAEDFFPSHKDAFVTKPHKPSPFTLRMVVLTIVMISGVYIFSFCLRQITNKTRFSVEVIDRSFSPSFEHHYVHYPHPETFSRAECEGNPVRFFVIISMQRSGTGWFETLLNSHVNISSNGEIFSVQERRRNVTSIISNLDKVYNLDWLSSASKNECAAAVGFKWMINQGLMEYHAEIAEYFNRRGVSAIFLFRRNLLRRMISLLANSYDQHAKLINGTHKSHVHTPEEADVLSKYKPIIDSKYLVPNLREMQSTASKALEYFHTTRHIVLYYEDLVNNSTKMVDVLHFLRMPRMELTSKQVKIHRGPLWEHIRNWDDVRRTLNGTVYESFLYSDDY